MPIADRLFTNASFQTLDPTAPTAEALASWQGRIVAVGSRADVDALVGPGTEVVDLDAGCCGMAGSFGYEKEHYDLSMKIGEEALFPAIRAKDDDWEVAVMGVSCRQQVEDGTGRKARHLVEVLADALE